jgi:predicted DsbA family dithiol-disulfide isomerase
VIESRPFDLHPEYPPEGIPRSDLVARYGTGMVDRLAAMFTEAGLPSKPELELVPNSRRALMLGELARDRGLHDQLHPRLFDAYWARGRDLGDEVVLLEEGSAVGLDESEIREALVSPEYLERVVQQTAAATELGVSGVPAWVVDQRLLVPGAQPHEVFDQALAQLGHQPIEP